MVVNIHRVKEQLIELGRLGRKNVARVKSYEELSADKGLWRLEGNEFSRASKDYLVVKMKEAGLNVRFDRVGNIFGRKEGRDPGRKAVMSGSHLDSVKNGGQFDGPLGVIGALEAARVMSEEGFEHSRPIEVAVFVGEEGSAFERGLIGSEVLAGGISQDEVLNLANSDGELLKNVLSGYRGEFLMDLDEVEYFLELHPEQGPVLDAGGTPIGIVESITGLCWLRVLIEGEENHAGTTPMKMRKDALVRAAGMVTFVHEKALEMAEKTDGSFVATTGRIEAHPSATNIIPGRVELGIDIRDIDRHNIESFTAAVNERVAEVGRIPGIKTKSEILINKPPSLCSEEVVEAIARVARELGLKARRMSSGAAHDAQNLAGKVKTAMIFVPSINGISHSPWEWTDWDDVEKGVHVLTGAIKELAR